MTILRRHLFTTLVAMIIAAACGTFAGYQLANSIAARVTDRRLDAYASRLFVNEEETSAKLRTVLAAVSASQHRSCSGDEIDYFRTLIFLPEYLKDAGRIQNGKIECSAALGRSVASSVLPKPDFTLQNGLVFYKNLTPYENNGLATITLQLGDAFVVFNPATGIPRDSEPLHYTLTAIDKATQARGRLPGQSLLADAPILTSEGRTRIGDNLYVTRCSTRTFTCVTAYTSISEILHANRGKTFALVGACRLLGGLAGCVLSFLYYRHKGVEQQLRRAIRKDELFLVYQPIVELQSRRITGAEALVRWTNKQGVEVSPEVFVKIAEEHGFVGEITKQVVRHALSDFGETLRSHAEFRLSINTAAGDLENPSFLPMLNRSLDEAEIPARNLAVEITERSTVKREAAIETIRGLRERGHSVHIDDFGTGYSSLSYLHDLSVDAIKIDRVFTQTVGTGSAVVGILPQILAMAKALNLQIIIEGVETEEQASYFESAVQPVLAQGWLFGRPVPAAEFLCLLAKDEENAQVEMQTV
jgi:sensor c-di-GMP phosphodiesterase-like protein